MIPPKRAGPLFDQALVAKIIEDAKLPDTVEPYLAERVKFPITSAMEEMMELHPSEWTLFQHSANTIRNLCRMGSVIVVGRAGNFVTMDLPNVFHVRLIGSNDKRIARVSTEREISLSDATQLVKETDKGRAKYVKRYTGSSSDSPESYHMVLNMDDFSDETAVRILGDSLLEWANEKWQQETEPLVSIKEHT